MCVLLSVHVCVAAPSPLPPSLSVSHLPVSRCVQVPVRVYRRRRVYGHLPCRLVRVKRLPFDPSTQTCLYVHTQTLMHT